MKKLSLFLLLCLCAALLAACSPADPKSDDRDAKVHDYMQNTIGGSINTSILETEHSIYLLHDGYLYFSDREYKDFIPLCSRPNCMHNDPDCNANINAHNFTVYKDYVYYVDTFAERHPHEDEEPLENYDALIPHLCRARLDGSKHEELIELPVPEANINPKGLYYNFEFCFSNKYLLARALTFDYVLDDLVTGNYVIDLDDLSIKEVDISALGFDIGFGNYVITGKGDLLYMCCWDPSSVPYLCVLDFAAGSISAICRLPKDPNIQEFCFYLDDETLYSVHWTYGSDEVKLNKCDITTGNNTEIASIPVIEAKALSFDISSGDLVGSYRRPQPGYEYTRPYWGLYVYDTDMNEIECSLFGEGEEGDELSNIRFAFQTESYIFGVSVKPGGVLDLRKLMPEWYIEKSEIGSGGLYWQKWEP